MRKIGVRRAVGWVLAILVLILGMSPPVRGLDSLPGAIQLTQGYQTKLNLSMPLDAEIQRADVAVVGSTDETLNGRGVLLTGEGEGETLLVLKFLGIPVKTIGVTVEKEKTLIPGGHSIGVALRMDGVLVVGASDVGANPSPARTAGLRSGDRIVQANGQTVESASQLSAIFASGSPVTLSIERDGGLYEAKVTPVRADENSAYRLGAWVRDSTAGVGTLSFYDPQNGSFAALGHAITDQDTGSVLTVSDGAIFESRILDVLKGDAGQPGELLGEFNQSDAYLGEVFANSDFGLYGKSENAFQNTLYPNGLPIATRDEVHLGPASLLTTLDSGGIQSFDCEVVKLFHQDTPMQRGMVVKITDEALLQKTGGIVQGMSGSPLIQDGRLIGAVTHVFVNDPTQGYGMYIEWMLQKSENVTENDARNSTSDNVAAAGIRAFPSNS